MNGSGGDSYGGSSRDSRHGFSSRGGERERGADRHREGGDHHSSGHRDRGERSDRGDRGDRGERRGDRERRRSRSPYGRSSRRDDNYYDSRDFRDREREREHGGRERGGERGGERDLIRGRRPDRDRLGVAASAGGDDVMGDRRRGHRGERGDRSERGDRGDRGDRGERDAGGRSRREEREMRSMGAWGEDARQPRKEASPPPRKKEPTPDLTDTIPINERKRRLTMWDIKPPGYENVTAEQAKLSGMFPLPGAPRQAQMDPSRLQAFMNAPPGIAVNNTALKPSNSRQSKRLFISDLPPMITEEALHAFFNSLLGGLSITEAETDPVISAHLNPTSTFGMLEFRHAGDATLCLAFDGLEYEDTNVKIKIARPKDYIIPQYAEVDPAQTAPGEPSPTVPDSLNKICVSSLPSHLVESQIIELLATFGQLKAFVLVKDRDTQESRGVAFCEYQDPATTEIALEGLNGMELGDRLLHVQRASIGVKQSAAAEMGINAMTMMAGTTSSDMEGGRVLQLLNMVTPEELMDPEEYDEICEDIQEECGKFGAVIDMKIPRPSGGSRQSPGIGKVFVRFAEPSSADKALRTLAGRKFADRTVVCSYFSEDNYDVGAW